MAGVLFAVPSAAWSPLSLSDLAAWHKADAGLTLSGSQVTSWADQSGKGVTLNGGAGSTGPTYQATGYNSKPTVSFNGTDDWLVSSGLLTFSNSKDMSCFVVGQLISGINSYVRMVALSEPSGTDYGSNSGACLIIKESGSTLALGTYYWSAPFNMTAVTLSTNYRIGAIIDGDTGFASFYLNGAIQGTPSVMGGQNFSTAYYALGDAINGNAGGSSWMNCLISEVVLVNGVLSGTDITNLDNYFVNKWGT